MNSGTQGLFEEFLFSFRPPEFQFKTCVVGAPESNINPSPVNATVEIRYR